VNTIRNCGQRRIRAAARKVLRSAGYTYLGGTHAEVWIHAGNVSKTAVSLSMWSHDQKEDA
jgi:hypothetical protein